MNWKKYIAIPILTLSAGCSTTTPHFTSMNFEPSKMEIIGPATGETKQFYFLGIGPAGGSSDFGIDAVNAALKSSGGDVLLNIIADEKTTYDLFLIFYHRTVTIHGIAARFKK